MLGFAESLAFGVHGLGLTEGHAPSDFTVQGWQDSGLRAQGSGFRVWHGAARIGNAVTKPENPNPTTLNPKALTRKPSNPNPETLKP